MIEIIYKDDFTRRREVLARTRARNVSLDAELMRVVTSIVEDVRIGGDEALIEYTKRFDEFELETRDLAVDKKTLQASASKIDCMVLAALREAVKRITRFHEQERERFTSWSTETNGVKLGQRLSAIEAVGLYVPGGTAAYPSSVLMNVIPARVAGVKRLVVVTPPKMLQQNPAVAAALLELNVSEIYQVGGAQSIAALAFGTQTIKAVDKITGPGNKYVTAAKKIVYGTVGIDSLAGPSEVVIIADSSANASHIAADLLAQAEHDAEASSILITNDERLAHQVQTQIEAQLETLPRREIACPSIENFGAIIVTTSIDEACEVANGLAPEHLEIITEDAEKTSEHIRHAGAIFLGSHTPEAVGDYFAGPNHVLPTGGAARYSSALGVGDFMRHTSILRYTKDELNKTAAMIAALAKAEQLEAHARSITIRSPVNRES